MILYFSTQLNYHTFFSSSCIDLALESNPSDHPRASTIFLSKSQTHGKTVFFSSEKKTENCFCFVYLESIFQNLYIGLNVSLFHVSTCLLLTCDDTLCFVTVLVRTGRQFNILPPPSTQSAGYMIQMRSVSTNYYVLFLLLQRAHTLRMNNRIQVTVRFSLEQTKKIGLYMRVEFVILAPFYIVLNSTILSASRFMLQPNVMLCQGTSKQTCPVGFPRK